MVETTSEILPPPMVHHEEPRTYGGNNAFHNFYNDYSHISDPNLRRRLALSEIDKVPFGWYHVRAIVVAGVGLFLDSYDIFAINLITMLLGVVFWSGDDKQDGYGGDHGYLPEPVNQALKGATNGGIVMGMLMFGWLADAYGRRRMYGIELAIVLAGTLSCALAAGSPAISAVGLLIFWRIVMGIGIGGDYPLSSVITSEFAPTRWRGGMVAAVFSMQGLGQLAAAIVSLITITAYRESFLQASDISRCGDECRQAADRCWRIIVGVGAIPACFAIYYRITIPETPRYTFDIKHDVKKADADIRSYLSSKVKADRDSAEQPRFQGFAEQSLEMPRASWSDLFHFFSEWKNTRMLIGTSLSWMFLDLAFYGLGLNTSIVIDTISYDDSRNLYHKLHSQAVGLIILSCAGSLPGYCAAIFTVDTLGRKPLQVCGFLILTVLFSVLGFAYNMLNQGGFLGLYIVCQFFFNAGPNTTTFIIPGECFPTRYRTTAHGFSAAMGKVGAIVAQVISEKILHSGSPPEGCTGIDCSPNLNRLLQLFALFMLLGTLSSLLVPETKGYTLEELSGEPRTSYNAGRNGSISMESPRLRAWNPFSQGQPAGFKYPRQYASSFGRGKRGSRVGIMTSIDSGEGRGGGGAASSTRQRRSRFWRQGKKTRPSTGDSTDFALSTRGSADAPSAAGGGPAPPLSGQQHEQQEVPAWGAGWGRIDRGQPPGARNNMNLRDVGMLLHEEV